MKLFPFTFSCLLFFPPRYHSFVVQIISQSQGGNLQYLFIYLFNSFSMVNKVEIDSFVGSLPYFDWKTEPWLKQKMKGVQRKIGCQWIHNLPSVKDKSKPDKVNCAELSEKRGEKLNCEVVQASWFRVRVWHPTFISAVWHFRPYKPYIFWCWQWPRQKHTKRQRQRQQWDEMSCSVTTYKCKDRARISIEFAKRF